jgi:DNA-binding transcriptional LysR family regulator
MAIGFEQLRVFQAVARELSFTRAADKLHRTQPGVSQIIRALEEALGEPLFIRQGKTITLTQAGRVLIEHAEAAFKSLDLAKHEIEGLRELRHGVLTISTSDTTAFYLLPEILKRFRDRYPGVEMRILSKPSPVSAQQVAAHEADLGIVTLPIDHPRLTTETLMVREDVAICATDHPLAQADAITFEAMTRFPLLLLDHGSNTRSYIDQRFLMAGLTPVIAMEIGSIEVIKKLVQLNFGISIVPLIAVREEVKQGSLVPFRIFTHSECRRLGIIYPVKSLLPPAAKVFVEMLKEYIHLNFHR